jgi:hypothetical protein
MSRDVRCARRRARAHTRVRAAPSARFRTERPAARAMREARARRTRARAAPRSGRRAVVDARRDDRAPVGGEVRGREVRGRPPAASARRASGPRRRLRAALSAAISAARSSTAAGTGTATSPPVAASGPGERGRGGHGGGGGQVGRPDGIRGMGLCMAARGRDGGWRKRGRRDFAPRSVLHVRGRRDGHRPAAARRARPLHHSPHRRPSAMSSIESSRPLTPTPAADAARPLAVVTGASSGIGRELARIFVAHRHDVVVSRRGRGARPTRARSSPGRRRARSRRAAPTSPRATASSSSRRPSTAWAVPLDALALNAGVGVGGRSSRPTSRPSCA